MTETPGNFTAEPLTDRELEILQLVAKGNTNREIADRLFLSTETIKWHNKRAFGKLGAGNRTEAVARARAFGLLRANGARPAEPRNAAAARLPAELSSFVGRQREIDALLGLLERARLVTLTGPGGIGKTRLALRVAGAARARFHEAAFVSLAAVGDPEQVAHRLAQELGVMGSAESTAAGALRRFLRDRHLLLVVDNFEHLLPAAPLLADLLAAAPRLHVITTSREVLNLTGEHEFAVPPLPTPDAARRAPAADLATFPAVTLFVQRARAVSAEFALTAENAPAVGAICTRLDGLPLAIELAAARVKLFTPQQLLARLDRRLDLLTNGARDRPDRHNTLRDTIAWSYDLLKDDERRLFRRLSVFTGGCSLDAVEAVCGTGPDATILDGLHSLVSKSLLLTAATNGAEPRFYMLDTINEFAREQLTRSGESCSLRDRHLAYYRGLVAAWAPQFRRRGQLALLDRADGEFANLEAAFTWSLETGDVAAAAELLSGADYYLIYSHNVVESFRWLEALLPHIDTLPDRLLVRTLLAASRIHSHNGRLARAVRCGQRGLGLARRLGDRENEAWFLVHLSLDCYELGEEPLEKAVELCEEGLAIFREQGNGPGTAFGLNVLGELWRGVGAYERAGTAYAASTAACRATGEVFREAILLTNLSFVACNEGKYEEARAHAEDHLRKLDSVNMKKRCDCLILSALAGALAQLGEPEKATRLLAAAELYMEEMGAEYCHVDAQDVQKHTAAIRAALDPAAFDAAWAEGRMLSLEEAIAYALDEQDGGVFEG